MTLNITVAARWLMVQSSDFRLMVDGQAEPESETAQKQVVLQYFGWSGLLCYTGVAKYGSHDTARWLGQVLTHEGGQRTPGQVGRRLAEKANVWLKRVPAKDRFHTFTLVTHERTAAHIYLVSTHERLGREPLTAPANPLLVSHARVRRTVCAVTGWSPAVTSRQREQLKQLLATNPEPKDMRQTVAFASREASLRAKHKVGKECIVAHLLPDGTGGAAVFGELKDSFSPALISNGINIGEHIPNILRNSGSDARSLVGLDWKSQTDKSAMVMYWRDLSTQTGSGWPPEDSQPGGVGIRLIEAEQD